MRAVVNRRVYDTETATEICRKETGRASDGTDLTEVLYRTRRGLFFLYMAGGPRSKAAEVYALGTSAGERIMPVADYEARAFAEGMLSLSEELEVFGKGSPDDPVTILVTVPRSMRERIKAMADKRRVSMSALIGEAISESLGDVD